ncbi:MAG: hypothetical protein RL481_2469, partial [Pseudomonadota bacterium]
MALSNNGQSTIEDQKPQYGGLRAWTTVAMLFVIQTINRADKAVLGL